MEAKPRTPILRNTVAMGLPTTLALKMRAYQPFPLASTPNQRFAPVLARDVCQQCPVWPFALSYSVHHTCSLSCGSGVAAYGSVCVPSEIHVADTRVALVAAGLNVLCVSQLYISDPLSAVSEAADAIESMEHCGLI